MEKRITVRDLAKMKAEGRKITTVTSYDAITARLVDEAGIQLILVGDSAGNTVNTPWSSATCHSCPIKFPKRKPSATRAVI